MKAVKDTVKVEETVEASPKEVWAALTDIRQMREWYFDLKEFRAEPGFKFSFTGGEDPSKPYIHLCVVTESIPGKKLAYSWRYKDYNGESHVVFEIERKGSASMIIVTHSGLSSFPKDNPDLHSDRFEEGWKYIIGTSLKSFLEKGA